MNLNRAIFLLERITGRKVLLEAKMTNDEIYDKYYFDIKKEDFDKILEADPTKKPDGSMGKFSKWLLDLYKNKNLKLEDLYKATEYLTLFAKYQQKIDKKDIKQYKSLPELYDAVAVFEENPDEYLSNSEKEKEAKKGTEKIWENNNWIILSPKSKEASCYYGKGTQWCTASTKANNMFDYYNKKGPLYIIIGKKNGRKFQFNKEEDQFMDERDNSIIKGWNKDSEDIKLLTSDKELSKEIEKLWGGSLPVYEGKSFEERMSEYLNSMGKGFPKHLNKIIEEGGLKRTLEIAMSHKKGDFLIKELIEKKYIKNRDPELEKHILKSNNAELQAYYVFFIYGKRWPEVEASIMKSPYFAYEYALSFIGRWKEAEPYIMKDPETALNYATDFLGGRWKEAEPYIKKDKDLWEEYQENLDIEFE